MKAHFSDETNVRDGSDGGAGGALCGDGG